MCLCILRVREECCWNWWRRTRPSLGIHASLSYRHFRKARQHRAGTVRAGWGLRCTRSCRTRRRDVFRAACAADWALLTKHNFDKQQIDAFAVASGPGSFTGLRVGLAAIKALAEVLAKPIAAVSLLEAVAMAGGVEGDVIAALDAGRKEIYAGEYEVHATSKRNSE